MADTQKFPVRFRVKESGIFSGGKPREGWIEGRRSDGLLVVGSWDDPHQASRFVSENDVELLNEH